VDDADADVVTGALVVVGVALGRADAVTSAPDSMPVAEVSELLEELLEPSSFQPTTPATESRATTSTPITTGITTDCRRGGGK
jgi:hypothetical protein